ncbi:MAG: response regulator [Caldilineaceae bacterium]
MSIQANVFVMGAEVIMTNLLRILLESDGYQVATVRNRSTANPILHTERVDLIVFDVPPFEPDVVAVVEELRRMFDAPLIILSSAANPTVTTQALQVGASAYIVKPFSAQNFLDEVEQCLSQNKRAAYSTHRI